VTVSLEGFHPVKHALRFAPELVTSVTVRSLDEAAALCRDLAPDVAAPLLALAVAGEAAHPTGVVGTATRPAYGDEVLRGRSAPLVLLDGVRHAGNAGAAVRVAAAAGASGVVVDAELDPWHPAVVRGSAGLHFALPVLAASVRDVTGPVLVLDADGDPLRHVPDDAVLVAGSERHGVSRAARQRADVVVSLPMRPGVSSLNLATAVSAALYAWRLRG
jgi:RNA methyltransferase, TrmH family